MNILLSTITQEDTWFNELSMRLPGAAIYRGTAPVACEYALVLKPPPGLLSSVVSSKLKAVFSLAAGVDGLLGEVPPDVPVIRVEDGDMARQMEEYALYAVLESFRRFRLYRAQQSAHNWKPQSALSRSDFSVGVLGTGILGSAVINVLETLGFPVRGWSRSGCVGPPEDCLRDVLQQSDVVILLLPLTTETRGIINRSSIAEMRPGGVIVNLARGALIVDDHLQEALDSGHIEHAYLDVFHSEPLDKDHPWWDHPRISITPHVAAQTSVSGAVEQIVAKIEQLEAGKRVSGMVDPQAGY